MGEDGPPYQKVREHHLDSLVEYAVGCVRQLGWKVTPVTLLHSASWVLIDAIMGRDWYVQLGERRSAYLDRPKAGVAHFPDWWRKGLRLADTLYALQDEANIADRLRRMKGPNLESTIAELSVIERLRFASPVWLRPESEGGYDADVMLDDNLMCAVEIKCRLEETGNTRAGILNRLKKARKQLPKDRPTLIWVRHDVGPTRAVENRATVEDNPFESAAREFLRNTRSVSALVYSCEMALVDVLPPGEPFSVGWGHTAYVNDAAQPPDSLRRLLDRLGRLTVRDGVLVAPVQRALARLHGATSATASTGGV